MDILVVVDTQNDFISGSLGTPEAQAIVSKVVTKYFGQTNLTKRSLTWMV